MYTRTDMLLPYTALCRSGSLAAFALTMKACSYQRRFLRRAAKPNICILESVTVRTSELSEYAAAIGQDTLVSDFQDTLEQFADARSEEHTSETHSLIRNS